MTSPYPLPVVWTNQSNCWYISLPVEGHAENCERRQHGRNVLLARPADSPLAGQQGFSLLLRRGNMQGKLCTSMVRRWFIATRLTLFRQGSRDMATQEDGARIGDRCRTLTALRPSGKVAVAGVEFEARSEGQWIDPERDCVVVSGDDRGLIVRAVEKDSPIPALANHGAPALEGRLKGKTCLRCDAQLDCLGTKMFHEGVRWGVLGDLAELFTNRESFEVYVCPRCGHVEFFVESSSQ